METCRECHNKVSKDAISCPHCGAPYPAKPQWDGWGYEYKSKSMVGNLPLVHVSFKYRPNRMPVPAKGVIAIGQFGVGIVTIAQFGVGMIGLGQFMVGGLLIAQFAAGHSILAQMGIFISSGKGQIVRSLGELLGGGG